MTDGTSLHYIHPDYNVGDVHPYYDSDSKTWYMYYLKPQSYDSMLLTSTDLLHWAPKEIQFTGGIPPRKYFTLGVLKKDDKYYSYYGAGNLMAASVSENLMEWNAAPFSYAAKNDLSTFPATSRDPYTFFDPDTDSYKCVSSAYRTHEDWGYGKGLDCSLALATTTDNQLNSWTGKQQELIHFPDGGKGEPECPQMFKQGSRWYLLASMARRTPNWVGAPSYWVGEPNTRIEQDNWEQKSERRLDGEDLCAAQVAECGNKLLMFGWIAKNHDGNCWGGELCLPREVYQLQDGSLGVRLERTVKKAIRGNTLEALPSTNLKAGESITFAGNYDRFDLSLEVGNAEGLIEVMLGVGPLQRIIRLDTINGMLGIYKNLGDKPFATLKLDGGKLNSNNTLHVIAEDNIIEVFLNDRYSLAAKVDKHLTAEAVAIASIQGTAAVSEARIYHLNFLEEAVDE